MAQYIRDNLLGLPKNEDGVHDCMRKRVVLRGMTTKAPKDDLAQQMEMLLVHGGMHSTTVQES